MPSAAATTSRRLYGLCVDDETVSVSPSGYARTPRGSIVTAAVRGRHGHRHAVEVRRRPRGDDSRPRARVRHVDTANARVRVLAAHDAEVEEAARRDVVEVPAAAADEALVRGAAGGRPDHFR